MGQWEVLVQHADHLATQTPPTTLNAVNITFSKQVADEQHKYIPSEQSSRVIKQKRTFYGLFTSVNNFERLYKNLNKQ